MTFPSRHLNVTIDKSAKEVYAFVSNPENLPQWAAGLSSANLKFEKGDWVTDSPMGKVKIHFAPKNDFGILDHVVTLPDGAQVLNPLRVIPNDKGSEVIFSILQLKGMSDEQFRHDSGLVEKDLQKLKLVLEKK